MRIWRRSETPPKSVQNIAIITIWKIPQKRHHWRSRRGIWSQIQDRQCARESHIFQIPKQIRKEAVTCARKLSRQDLHHVREEICYGSHVMRIWNFFLSVFRIMCAWALSFSQMPRVMCAGSFTTFLRIRPECHKVRSRPARSCTADHNPPRPDPRGARDTSSLWCAKVRGSRHPV